MALSTNFNDTYASLVDRLETQAMLRNEGNIPGLFANRRTIDELRLRLAMMRIEEVA